MNVNLKLASMLWLW